MENGNNNNNNNDDNNGSIVGRETLDQVASWVSATVISAFFSSLERCSCVHLVTIDPDDDDDDDDESNELPLTISIPASQPTDETV